MIGGGLDGRRPVRLLGIGGSMRRASLGLTALRAALRLAEKAGAETVLADVRALDLPLYDEDRPRAAYPAALGWLLDEVRAADGFVLCSPTDHGTITGAVKNALDAPNVLGDRPGAARPPDLGGRPMALMALGDGGAANVLTSLYHASRGLRGLAIPTTVIVPPATVDAERVAIADERVRRRLAGMVEELIGLATRLQPAEAAVAGSPGPGYGRGDDGMIDDLPALVESEAGKLRPTLSTG